jgi:hypothetical protein
MRACSADTRHTEHSSPPTQCRGQRRRCCGAHRVRQVREQVRNPVPSLFLRLRWPANNAMEQAPVQIGQFILGKNLGIGAFGKVRRTRVRDPLVFRGCLQFLDTPALCVVVWRKMSVCQFV